MKKYKPLPLNIKEIINRDIKNITKLGEIWFQSVKQTHLFLTSSDINEIYPEVIKGLQQITILYGYYDTDNILQGFIGIENSKIEMLFTHPNVRNQGIEKQLLQYALSLGVTYVDVNEQNSNALGFYQHFGFSIKTRSSLDTQGRPFPILHLQLT